MQRMPKNMAKQVKLSKIKPADQKVMLQAQSDVGVSQESDLMTLLAWSDRDIVFGEKSMKISHGTTWFHNANRGIGFAKFGHFGKDPCDIPKDDNEAQFRLCWALVESEEDANRRGFTCGTWD